MYFEARRQGVDPLPASKRPRLSGVERLQCLVFILPPGTLCYFLFAQPSVQKAGFYGFIMALVARLILFRSFRGPGRVYQAFVAAHIAGADPVQTGFQAARLALAGFLIPFVSVYHPAVLYKLQVLFERFGDNLPRAAL